MVQYAQIIQSMECQNNDDLMNLKMCQNGVSVFKKSQELRLIQDSLKLTQSKNQNFTLIMESPLSSKLYLTTKTKDQI